MAAKHIHTCNIPELKSCYELVDMSGPASPGNLATVFKTTHPEFGTFNASRLELPQLLLLNVDWHIPTDIVLHESETADTVDMNFVIEGDVIGKFNSTRHHFGLRAGHHNLKFTPEQKSIHEVAPQETAMFAISLDKNYFRSLIGCDDHWSEMVNNKIERNEFFFGADAFLPQCPRMQSLINAIKNTVPLPGSRLRTQYMIFELLSLQVDGLRSHYRPVKRTPDQLNATDAEKLHQLKQFVDQHFLEDHTLTDLCRRSMLNEFKLKKGFKTLFGTSVIQYVKQLRMQYAQTLLRDHRMSIEEVSVQVGYQYPNHFSAAYKKYFGIGPSYSGTKTSIALQR